MGVAGHQLISKAQLSPAWLHGVYTLERVPFSVLQGGSRNATASLQAHPLCLSDLPASSSTACWVTLMDQFSLQHSPAWTLPGPLFRKDIVSHSQSGLLWIKELPSVGLQICQDSLRRC